MCSTVSHSNNMYLLTSDYNWQNKAHGTILGLSIKTHVMKRNKQQLIRLFLFSSRQQFFGTYFESWVCGALVSQHNVKLLVLLSEMHSWPVGSGHTSEKLRERHWPLQSAGQAGRQGNRNCALHVPWTQHLCNQQLDWGFRSHVPAWGPPSQCLCWFQTY